LNESCNGEFVLDPALSGELRDEESRAVGERICAGDPRTDDSLMDDEAELGGDDSLIEYESLRKLCCCSSVSCGE
jgi:hypothetical protein